MQSLRAAVGNASNLSMGWAVKERLNVIPDMLVSVAVTSVAFSLVPRPAVPDQIPRSAWLLALSSISSTYPTPTFFFFFFFAYSSEFYRL